MWQSYQGAKLVKSVTIMRNAILVRQVELDRNLKINNRRKYFTSVLAVPCSIFYCYLGSTIVILTSNAQEYPIWNKTWDEG